MCLGFFVVVACAIFLFRELRISEAKLKDLQKKCDEKTAENLLFKQKNITKLAENEQVDFQMAMGLMASRDVISVESLQKIRSDLENRIKKYEARSVRPGVTMYADEVEHYYTDVYLLRYVDEKLQEAKS